MTDTLNIKLTEGEARSILRAHETAIGETKHSAVAARVVESIAKRWPDARGDFQIHSDDTPTGVSWKHAHDVSSLATHDWLLSVETWSVVEGSTKRTVKLFASPLIFGAPVDEPFATALAINSDLVVLLPQNVPDVLRQWCLAALEDSGMLRWRLDMKILRDARTLVLYRWKDLIAAKECFYDEYAREWRMV
jgi:hypothetical protein